MMNKSTSQVEKHRRGPVGWITVALFWVFHLVMMGTTLGLSVSAIDEIESIRPLLNELGGSSLTGVVEGAGLVVVIWGIVLPLLEIWALGSIALGILLLVTKGKKIIVTVEQDEGKLLV